jgi:conjugative relaxase-like TrwC/TraI family protein
VLSIAKLGAVGQRYYLDQAQMRVDHRQSVASGVEDYYLAAPEAPGEWMGAEAEHLGLANQVVSEEALHRALCWTDPLTGQDLPGPISRARVPGFDLLFSTPKSASVLFGICDPSVRATIRRAQREAVAQASNYLESAACRGRTGAGGQGEGFAGRGFLAAAFEHRTSRAGDPQLHTHVLIANAVQRPAGQWAALDGRLLYAHAKTAGYIHEAAFRHALARDLGIEWRRPVNGIADIKGVMERVLDAFSRRSHEIDAYVRRRGEASAAARQVAAVRTREAKDYGVTPAELQPEWVRRAAELGLTPERVEALYRDRSTVERLAPADEVARVLAGREGLTRASSHFDRLDVVQRIAELAAQGATWPELRAAAGRFLNSEFAVPLEPAGARRSDVIRRADGQKNASMYSKTSLASS